ncbi:methylmalonyl-CoA mutase family protein [Ammoniphilus sp. YIM 78166]|uniref:methylmalonyl-CoA mutase family protein n=1 Tax=Ammoniphilus sp. YIM 78166 TaxID=1644106 RepID=UPI00107003F3|nr:methylmalonyl-CoA mutase family protein [Ammoniphilus sp. YIM 78166]
MSHSDKPSFSLPTFEEFPLPSFEEWQKAAEKALKGTSYAKLIRTTYEGLSIEPLYRSEQTANLPHMGSLPGFAPFVRGTHSLGYLSKAWEVAQEYTAGHAEDFNRQAQFELQRGQSVLNIVLDRATRKGQDPDQAHSEDLMMGGLSLYNLDDLKTAFKGIDLAQVPLMIHTGAFALPVASLVLAYMDKNGYQPSQLQGVMAADPLGTLAEEGRLDGSMDRVYDDMATWTQWAAEHSPRLQTIFVRVYPYHDGGAHAVQELAYALATGVEYLRELQERSVDIQMASKAMVFSFSIGSHFFMEIAKLRAAKMLWAKVIEAFGGNEDAQKMKIHARTSVWNKTLLDPYVNMLRSTAEAFAGIVGGVDSLHVSPFDEVVRTPDEFSRRIARNTQLILESEAHLGKVIDPSGGSWYVEALTDQVAEQAWKLFQEIEASGGMLNQLKNGAIQRQVKVIAEQRRTNVSQRKDRIVGTNMYANLQEKSLSRLSNEARDSAQQQRSASASRYRQERQLQAHLETGKMKLEEAVVAIGEGATLGEITQALHPIHEGAVTVSPIDASRGSVLFEELRKAAEAYKERTGGYPKIFLANLGSVAEHKPRADFSASFFQVGGFEVISNQGFVSIEEASLAASQSGAIATVICSADSLYPELVPALVPRIKDLNPHMIVYMAGVPAEVHSESYKQAGVDQFIHLKTNCFEFLSNLQRERGISL